ncbi:hypothetical protein [Streptomyces pilosus]|uniref:Uncharacterized protein n=2 Tax=Streptomyces pilosus TaxID=28893 RepID=A0A918BJ03_9ACTN|nr:hypothetical protein [Streptomyces pilosus]GGQ71545.1 hypothetical protein GCM10010280_17110 [Streptomyces pilosus]
MADATPAPRRRNRLTRESPEAGLARELISTEYRRRNERRRRAEGPALATRAWRALRDMWRDLTGRSRGVPPSYGADTGFPDGAAQEVRPVPGPPGPGPGPVPGPPAGPPPPPREGRDRALEGIVERIDRLPQERREAFEDAVLHLLRTDRKWRRAYDEDPAGMPWAARCANHAYEREVLREAPGAAGPGPARRGEAPSRGSADPDAGPPLPDGDAPWTVAEAFDRAGSRIRAADAEQFAAFRERFVRPAAGARETPEPSSPDAVLRGPGGNEAVYDGHAFTTVEEASRAAGPAPAEPLSRPVSPAPSPPSPPPSPLSRPADAVSPPSSPVSRPVDAVSPPSSPVSRPVDAVSPPSSPVSRPVDAVSPPSSPVSSPAGPVSPPSGPVPVPVRPVGSASPAAESAAPSLLGPEGLRAARLPAATTTPSPDARNAGSRPSPAAVKPAAAPVRNRLK